MLREIDSRGLDYVVFEENKDFFGKCVKGYIVWFFGNEIGYFLFIFWEFSEAECRSNGLIYLVEGSI